MIAPTLTLLNRDDAQADAHADAVAMLRMAQDDAAMYRDAAVRLAGYVRAVAAAGDASAADALSDVRVGRATLDLDRFRTFRQAAMSAALGLERIEGELGEVLAPEVGAPT